MPHCTFFFSLRFFLLLLLLLRLPLLPYVSLGLSR